MPYELKNTPYFSTVLTRIRGDLRDNLSATDRSAQQLLSRLEENPQEVVTRQKNIVSHFSNDTLVSNPPGMMIAKSTGGFFITTPTFLRARSWVQEVKYHPSLSEAERKRKNDASLLMRHKVSRQLDED